MIIKAEYLRSSCQILVRELTNLQQLRKPLSIDEFFYLTENETFVRTLMRRYPQDFVGLNHLLDDNEIFANEANLLTFIENAFFRQANVITCEELGVKDDAYLLAINIAVMISIEASDM